MSKHKKSVDERIEALIEAEVARAMAPYRARKLPAHVLAEMEMMLRFALRNHPTAQQLLRALASAPIVDGSDNSQGAL